MSDTAAIGSLYSYEKRFNAKELRCVRDVHERGELETYNLTAVATALSIRLRRGQMRKKSLGGRRPPRLGIGHVQSGTAAERVTRYRHGSWVAS